MVAMRKDSWKFLPADYQAHLETVFRIPSWVASLPTDCRPEAYFDAQTKDVSMAYGAARIEKGVFNDALSEKKISRQVYDEVMKKLDDDQDTNETEMRVLKRQRKHLIEDAEESQIRGKESFSELLFEKVRLIKMERKPKFAQVDFRRDCLEFYGAQRRQTMPNGIEQKIHYCVVSGEWFEDELINHKTSKFRTQVTAAHIVSKSLEGPELDRLFDIGEVMLREPRNSLPLLSTIKKALDNGSIAIVPHEVYGVHIASYKVQVTDPSYLDLPYWGLGKETRKWSSLHGKILQFLTPEQVKAAQATLPEPTQKALQARGFTPETVATHRPAQRYLYFRAMSTFLMAKSDVAKNPGSAPWIKQFEAERGRWWVDPGKYAGQSMMRELALAFGDSSPQDATELAMASGNSSLPGSGGAD